MNDFSSWMQINWHALGTLFLQAAFLTAAVWFAREILKSIRAFQEQIGALLKLSLTGSLPERHSAGSAADRFFANASPYWLTPAEIPPAPAPAPEPIDLGPSRWALASHRLVAWLQTPMHTGDSAGWRRAIKWLQAPAGS